MPSRGELTLRAVILGGVITLVFTAANVYLGLARRPHLRHLDPGRRHLDGGAEAVRLLDILENNIVQTVASAAGTLAAIIFVLPGLVIIGWWHGLSLLDDGRGDRRSAACSA